MGGQTALVVTRVTCKQPCEAGKVRPAPPPQLLCKALGKCRPPQAGTVMHSWLSAARIAGSLAVAVQPMIATLP